MKKLFTLLALSIFFAFEASATVYVCKTQLKSGNTYTNVDGGTISNSSSGTAKVSLSGKTLTIENAIIKCTSNNSAIRIEEDGITIKFVGTCSVSATKGDYDGLQINSNGISTTLTGTGSNSVTLDGTDSGLFIEKNSTLTVKNINLTCSGVDNGIDGNDGKNNETLKLEGSSVYVKATSTNSSTVNDMAKITFGDGIDYYNFCYLNTSSHKVCDATGNTVSKGTVEMGNVTSYGFSVCGLDVHDKNYSKLVNRMITDNYLTEGTVGYTPSTHLLSFTNAKITTAYSPILYNTSNDQLIMSLKGTNNFIYNGTSTTGGGIYLKTSLYVKGYTTGTANFTMKNTYTPVFWTNRYAGSRAEISIEDCTISSNGCAIFGDGTQYPDVSVSNSTLTFGSNNIRATLAHVNSLSLTGCAIATSGVFYVDNVNGVGLKTSTLSNMYQGALKIDKLSSSDQYDVTINGKYLNKYNAADYWEYGMTGSLSYNNSSKTLTLNGVTLNTTNKNAISLLGNGTNYKLVLSGTNTITAGGEYSALYIKASGSNGLEISGSGSATFTSTKAQPLYNYGGGTVTLNTNSRLVFESKQGRGTVVSGLSIKKAGTSSKYIFKGNDNLYSSLSATSLSLTDMDFCYTNGEMQTNACYFDGGAVKVNGDKLATGYIMFAPITENYGITVGGVPVTNCNKSGVGCKYISSNVPTAVYFNSNTNTLNLTSTTIGNGGKSVNALKCSRAGLNVYLVGDVILEQQQSGAHSPDYSPLTVTANTTLKGTGTLTTKRGGVYVTNSAKLTIKDIQKMETAYNIGPSNILGTEELEVNNSNVTVNGSVMYFKNVSWPNGYLLTPANGRYDSTNRRIVDANGNLANKVVFGDKNHPTAIDAIEVNNGAEVKQIFDATGRESSTAKSGLNIIRMSDGTIRKVMVK